MDKSLLPSLISAAVSVLGAVWALATAQRSRANVLRAEESAKRAELVRVKALEATDVFLCALSELIQAVGGFKFLLENGSGLTEQSVPSALKPFSEKRTHVGQLRFRFAPYLSKEVLSLLDQVTERTKSVRFEIEWLASLEKDLEEIASMAAEDARARFLGAA